VRPVRFRATVPVQDRHHHVHEADVPRLLLNLEARNQVPARMTVVTFAPLPHLNGGFDFQSDGFATLPRRGIDEVGISLVRIVFEWRMIIVEKCSRRRCTRLSTPIASTGCASAGRTRSTPFAPTRPMGCWNSPRRKSPSSAPGAAASGG